MPGYLLMTWSYEGWRVAVVKPFSDPIEASERAMSDPVYSHGPWTVVEVVLPSPPVEAAPPCSVSMGVPSSVMLAGLERLHALVEELQIQVQVTYRPGGHPSRCGVSTLTLFGPPTKVEVVVVAAEEIGCTILPGA